MFEEGEMNAAVAAYQRKRIEESAKLAARYKIAAVAKLAGVGIGEAWRVIHTLRGFERRRNEERRQEMYETKELERRSYEEQRWLLEMTRGGSQEGS